MGRRTLVSWPSLFAIIIILFGLRYTGDSCTHLVTNVFPEGMNDNVTYVALITASCVAGTLFGFVFADTLK